MPGIGFTPKIDVSDAVKKLQALGVAFNVRELMNRVGLAGQAEINISFRREGNDEGKWKPLAASTIRQRRHGLGAGTPKILQDTGALLQSVTYNLVGKDSVRVGAGKDYGIKHQEGIGVPRRPFLPSVKRAVELVSKVVENWIAEITRKVRPGADRGPN